MADARRKTVAIIGAGPSGLSTARSMLARNIAPTLFEAKATIGGLWSPSRGAADLDIVALDPALTLNHSRYTCAFSDLAWPETAPMFPPVTEMGRYLERYREKYIPESALKLSCPVTKITRDDGDGGGGWRVEWRDSANGREGAGRFDFLAICSGFFSAPYVPPIPGLGNFKGEVLHSADFAKLDMNGKKKKIAVVGGSMTGVEAAAEIALKLSSSRQLSEEEKPEIVHLFSRPFWNLAKHFAVPNEADPTAPRFLPLDLLMYDFNPRAVDADAPSSPPPPPPQSPEEIARAFSEKIKSFVGSDQAELAPELTVTEKYMDQMPWVAISDSYGSFVRDGAIKPVLGRISSMDGTTLTLEKGEDYTVPEIADVDTVILATGYHPASSLQRILPEDLYAALTSSSSSSPTSTPTDANFAPLLLYKLCLHPALQQTAGFVGMYKGPFFGIIEMQGRWLSALFSGEAPWPSAPEMATEINELAAARAKRSDTTTTDARLFRPQWVAPDYVGVVNDIRSRLNLPLTPKKTNFSPNTLIPAHFAPTTTATEEEEEASRAIADLTSLLPPARSTTRFVAAAVFRALHGTWALSRRIVSRRAASLPSGTFTGTATFHPREATFTPSARRKDDATSCAVRRPTQLQTTTTTTTEQAPGGEVVEYLYSEHGTFVTDAGAAMTGARSYVFRYHPGEDVISVWFVKPDGSGDVDYFFHELEFLPLGAGDAGDGNGGSSSEEVVVDMPMPGGGWKARSEHLCVQDWYWPSYRFVFKPAGPDLERFWIRYKVEGPNKDYTAEASYGRP